MLGVAVAQAIVMRRLISQQSKEKQKILYMLLELQEKYKFAWFWQTKKVKNAIDKIYPKYPNEVKLLKKLYEQIS